MLSRRKFLTGAASAAAAVTAGPSLLRAATGRGLTVEMVRECAISARANEMSYVVLHPDMLRDLQATVNRHRNRMMRELRKSGRLTFDGAMTETKGVRFIE